MLDASKGVIVPACEECNRSKSLTDQYLRDVLALRIETHNLPELQGLRDKSIRSAFREGYVSPSRALLSTFKKVPRFSPTGDEIEPAAIVTADSAKVFEGLKWIVRGLHYFHTGKVLDPNLDFQWWGYVGGGQNKAKFDAVWPVLDGNGPFNIGDSLLYKVQMVQEAPDYGQWLMVFFDRIFFIVSVEEDSAWKAAEEAGLL